MHKPRFLFIFLIIILVVCIPASASSISRIDGNWSVAADGSCSISLQMLVELDEGNTEYTFPIPAEATDIYLNDLLATTRLDGNRQLVVLESGAGSYRVDLCYRLPNVVTRERQTATVQLPLLLGFDYPIQQLELELLLPGIPLEEARLHSGYHQQDIHSHVHLSQQENTLHCLFLEPIKDHETLLLTVQLDRTAFTDIARFQIRMTVWDVIILATSALAAAYYFLTLMPRLTRRTRCYGQPDGITAGEIGTCLTACGTDMALLVISWAQMGYLRIAIDREDHVTLYKQMDMGNERSRLEARCFQDLFHNRTKVDGTGQHYGAIARKMAAKSNLLKQLYSPKSGNPLIFRGLLVIPGLVLGAKMGVSLGGGMGTQVVLAILLSLFSGALCWFIQGGGKCMPLRDKTPLAISIGCCGLWLVPGIATDHTFATVVLLLMEFGGGIAAAYGGKRSELGIRSLAQIRGLRHHLKTLSGPELQQQLLKNGDYFYEMAPYALAMGIERRFARHMGNRTLPESGYLDVGTDRAMTAKQWSAELRYAAKILKKAEKRR